MGKNNATPKSSTESLDSNFTAITQEVKRLVFPTGPRASHSKAVLAILLANGHCCQYSYHQMTGFPIADFRTRISELTLGGWPIGREFHSAKDMNGEPQRCKHYWLDFDALSRLLEGDPVLVARCKMLVEQYGKEGRSNG